MTDYYPTNGTAPDSPAALFDNRIGLAEADQDDAYDAERVDVFEGEVLAVVDHVDTARPFTEADQDDQAEGETNAVEPTEPEDVTSTFSWAAPDRAAGERAPIIPPWLRSAEARKAAMRQAVSAVGYHTAFHAVRTPVYTVKTLGYSVVGCGRMTGKVTRWVRAEEGNYELRQKAAETNDAYTWQALNKIRERESRGRMWGLAIATAATLIVVAVLALAGILAPVLWAALAALIVVTVRAGRPADKPILGRVATGRRFTKLTGDLVRNSLVSLAVRGITAPGADRVLSPRHPPRRPRLAGPRQPPRGCHRRQGPGAPRRARVRAADSGRPGLACGRTGPPRPARPVGGLQACIRDGTADLVPGC